MRRERAMAVEQTRHFMAALADVRQAVTRGNRIQRGFLLTGDPSYLDVPDALSRMPAHLDALRSSREHPRRGRYRGSERAINPTRELEADHRSLPGSWRRGGVPVVRSVAAGSHADIRQQIAGLAGPTDDTLEASPPATTCSRRSARDLAGIGRDLRHPDRRRRASLLAERGVAGKVLAMQKSQEQASAGTRMATGPVFQDWFWETDAEDVSPFLSKSLRGLVQSPDRGTVRRRRNTAPRRSDWQP